jgi:hypothetical protein
MLPPILNQDMIQSRFEPTGMHKLVYHSVCHLAANHIAISRGNIAAVDRNRILYHRYRAVRLMKDVVAHPENIPVRSIVMAIWGLMVEAPEDLDRNENRFAFSPHLATNWARYTYHILSAG